MSKGKATLGSVCERCYKMQRMWKKKFLLSVKTTKIGEGRKKGSLQD